MKAVLLLLMLPVLGFAQYQPGQKFPVKARIVSDSLTYKGYLVNGGDSAILLSPTKRFLENKTTSIPVSSIRELHFKNKNETGFGTATAVFVLGFTLTAGLTKNAGDVDNDGKTSFWELIYTAIDGTTSRNRQRRNAALIVGGAGGTLALAAYLFTNKKLSFVFPLTNRTGYYKEKRSDINQLAGF